MARENRASGKGGPDIMELHEPRGVATASGWWEKLGALSVLRLRFEARADDSQWRAPRFLGSTLRGALGHALLKLVCVRDDRACDSCTLTGTCVYPILFEPRRAKSADSARGSGPLRRSPPYVLEWPRQIRSDGCCTFDLVLFGEATGLASVAVTAVTRALADGLGQRRWSLRVERIATVGAEGACTEGLATPAVLADLVDRRSVLSGEAEVRLQTPLRLKSGGRFARELPFDLLTLNAVRRVNLLARLQDSEAGLRDALLPRAADIGAVSAHLCWEDWQRRSARQQRAMPFGGVVGAVRFAGDLEPFSRLLRAVEVLHLGKGTAFGLGRIELAAF
ncbi:CRISPR system precrRNA processing endoribonuclease RAMP protein Cas6 [Planctomycetota bacterium]